MTPTKDQQAQEYAEKKMENVYSQEWDSEYVEGLIECAFKDSFRKERRLNIAAQIVASMIGSDDWTTWRGGSNKEIWHNMAKSSLEIADALIAEAEKGRGNA